MAKVQLICKTLAIVESKLRKLHDSSREIKVRFLRICVFWHWCHGFNLLISVECTCVEHYCWLSHMKQTIVHFPWVYCLCISRKNPCISPKSQISWHPTKRYFITIQQIYEKNVTTKFQKVVVLIYVVSYIDWISTKKESSKSDQRFSRYRLLKFWPALTGALYPLKQFLSYTQGISVKWWFHYFSWCRIRKWTPYLAIGGS